MAAFSNNDTSFYDNGTNGRSQRDFGGPMRNPRGGGFTSMHGMYGSENAQPRYANGRDPFGMQMQNIGANNMNFPYDAAAAQTWNAGPPMSSFPGNAMGQNGNYGPGARGPKSSRVRPTVNDIWDQGQPPYQAGGPNMLAPRPSMHQDDDDELIPTAIVIKNIPFAVKKEQLVQLMVDMNLPLPYAFNYHFDNGVFRGLAFANFTSPSETDAVINALNHMDLSGRKLRVEYKKMLPLQERERIEREKRERRGQLEEQHRPAGQAALHSQMSLSSMTRNTPSPLSHRGAAKPDINMNDGRTLEFFSEMTLFKADTSREVLIFPADLDPPSRRIIHTLAHHMGLQHTSRGAGEQRQVHVYRPAPGTNVSPPSLSSGFPPSDSGRPSYARGSNSDMHDGGYPNQFDRLRGQASLGLLDVDGYGRAAAENNLRNAKSFADLRSWSPSPVPSSASFPAALQTNGTRLQAQAQSANDTAGSSTPILTPTASSGTGAGTNDPPFLISSFSNMSMTGPGANQTSPRRQRNMFGGAAWDESQTYQPTGPIGSKRSVSMAPENSSSERFAMRQPRGPGANAIGFQRRNGRGSDEMRQAQAIAE